MSSVKYVSPKLKLTAQLKAPGGLAVAEALNAAQANLDELQPECRDELRRLVSEADACLRSLPDEFSSDSLRALYAISARGIGLGSLGGTPAADEVFVSLCDLLDYFLATGRCDREAVAVHVKSLHLVLLGAGQDTSGAAAEAILSGLKKLSSHFRR